MARQRSPWHARFWNRIQVTESDCWVWMGAKSKAGYGQLWSDGKVAYLHRLTFEFYVGPIPEGLTIDHLCRNRACCNPAHLEAVPLRENIRRSDSATANNARKTHCVNGHLFDEVNTQFTSKGRRCRACHRERQRRTDQ